MTNYIFGTKYSNKKQLNNSLWMIPLVMFVSVSSIPNNALAFEAALASSGSQKLVETKVATDSKEQTYSSAGIALASPPVKTELGDWHKIAFNGKRATYLLPLSEDVPPEPPKPVNIAQPGTGIILTLEGEASYYSRAGCLGCSPTMTMANGQPLDDNALTMAIGANRKHLVGHKARVTNLATGQSVIVRITDTGGFYQAKYNNRVADLTVASKQAIGMKGGVGRVKVEVF